MEVPLRPSTLLFLADVASLVTVFGFCFVVIAYASAF
jgi:hypothetical protein